jgi:hypothetical protein
LEEQKILAQENKDKIPVGAGRQVYPSIEA